MWSWKKRSVETRNSRGETVKKEVVTVTGRSHGSSKAPEKKSRSPRSVSSQGSWKPNFSPPTLSTQASLGSPSVNPQRIRVVEPFMERSLPEHQPLQPQRIRYDGSPLANPDRIQYMEPMEKKLPPLVAEFHPVQPQRICYDEPMEKKLYPQGFQPVNPERTYINEYLGKSVDRQGYKVPELQRQNNLGRGMNDYRQYNQDRQLANFSKEDLGYILAELIKRQQEGYGMTNFNLQNNQGRDFNGPKDGYQAFNNAKGFEYEDLTPPEGTDDEDSNAEDTNSEESEAEDTHSEDSDAEDTNVEDSDAEDTNIEDSDAEDSNIEDSDAEDSDDESPRSNVTDIDRRMRDLYMWRQPGRIY